MNKLLIIIFLFVSSISIGQNTLDVKFIQYLSESESHHECITEVNSGNLSLYSQSVRDSILFYKGWSEYSLKRLENSANTLLKVSDKSLFFKQSRLFAAYNLTHIGEYTKALPILNKMDEADIVLFEKAGISLLQRNYKAFDNYMLKVDTNKYYLKTQSQKLFDFSTVMKAHRHKSPLLAAGLSTVVPGLGKIYAGKTGEGISSFIACAGLGFVTWEQNRKNGIDDYRTILSGALFSLFYIGNIWGSYFTVLITENEFDDEYKNKILFNIHIPLRTIFN